MKYGTINCSCGQQFYFETVADHVRCINCDKDYDVSQYPVKGEVEEVEFTEIPQVQEPQNGTEGE